MKYLCTLKYYCYDLKVSFKFKKILQRSEDFFYVQRDQFIQCNVISVDRGGVGLFQDRPTHGDTLNVYIIVQINRKKYTVLYTTRFD